MGDTFTALLSDGKFRFWTEKGDIKSQRRRVLFFLRKFLVRKHPGPGQTTLEIPIRPTISPTMFGICRIFTLMIPDTRNVSSESGITSPQTTIWKTLILPRRHFTHILI